jgi:long-subunit fatty acid transport protein
MINPFWDFYSFNYLSTQSSGKGFTGAATENDLSGLLINPASVNIEKKFQVNAQYTYKSNQPWLTGLAFTDWYIKQQTFSGSIGFGYRIDKNFQIGFLYNNPAGYYLDLGEIIRTDSLGNEIGRYELYYNFNQHAFNLPFIYSAGSFKLGTSLSYTIYRSSTPGLISTPENPEGYLYEDDIIGETEILKAQFGFIFSSPFGFSIGSSVTSGGKSIVKYKFPSTGNEAYNDASFPWKVTAGAQYRVPKTSWTFSADYNFIGTSVRNNLRDRHDVHFGIENNITKNWTLRAGFFTLFDYRSDDANWFDPVAEYDQYFVTFGGSYKSKNVTVNLSVLTSEFSSGMIKNTIVNGGLTFDF